MGFLEKLFGGGPKYPPLKADSPMANNLEAMKGYLEDLTRDVNAPMEVVPADDSAYVFIGNPRKNFGLAWIEHGEIKNFKTLSEEKGVAQQKLLKMVHELKDAYHRSGDDKRFSTSIGGKDVVVTPSSSLAQEVKKIIGNA